MSIRWEVTQFRITGTDFSLFANGQMQVAANIIIRAVNPSNNTQYTLTTQELSRIQLIDYYVPGTNLSGSWTYTAIENEFAHSVPGSKDVPAEANQDRSNQTMRYWVSSTRVESKSIGVRIQQPNGVWIHTHSDAFDSHIVLRGIAPVHYTKANTEFERRDTAQGPGWDQDNYYLTSKVHPFKKANINSYRNEFYAIVGLRMSNAYFPAGGSSRYIHYIWQIGPQTTVTAGITHNQNGGSISPTSTQRITIRERAHAMCFTRLTIQVHNDPFSGATWFFHTWFTIFDLYGNSGAFTMNYSNRNLIQLDERGTRSVAEGDDEIVLEQVDVPEGEE